MSPVRAHRVNTPMRRSPIGIHSSPAFFAARACAWASVFTDSQISVITGAGPSRRRDAIPASSTHFVTSVCFFASACAASRCSGCRPAATRRHARRNLAGVWDSPAGRPAPRTPSTRSSVNRWDSPRRSAPDTPRSAPPPTGSGSSAAGWRGCWRTTPAAPPTPANTPTPTGPAHWHPLRHPGEPTIRRVVDVHDRLRSRHRVEGVELLRLDPSVLLLPRRHEVRAGRRVQVPGVRRTSGRGSHQHQARPDQPAHPTP